MLNLLTFQFFDPTDFLSNLLSLDETGNEPLND